MPASNEDDGVYVNIRRKEGVERMLFFRRVKSKTKPRLVLTDQAAEYIASQVARGRSVESIAEDLDVSPRTLYSDFNTEILQKAEKKGKSRFRENILAMQFKVAMSGNTTMLIWLGKNYLGQTDQPQQEEVPVSPIPEFVDELLKKVGR